MSFRMFSNSSKLKQIIDYTYRESSLWKSDQKMSNVKCDSAGAFDMDLWQHYLK